MANAKNEEKVSIKNNAQLTAKTIMTKTLNKKLEEEEKEQHYLIIETDKGRYIINVGKETVKKVNELTTP